jgi:hypothetical protein
MRIQDGSAEDHPTPLPLNESNSPATARPTAIVPGQLSGPTVAAADTVGQQRERLSGMEADVRGAMASGMSAEHDRRAHYQQGILPTGSAYGDGLPLPPVPPNIVPSEGSDLYPWSGMEPTPAGAGLDFYPGTPPQ